MKNFSTIAKALKFTELAIEGTFGDGYTLADFINYDKTEIKNLLKSIGRAYLVVRVTGAQAFSNERAAEKYFDDFKTTSHSIVKFEMLYAEKGTSVTIKTIKTKEI